MVAVKKTKKESKEESRIEKVEENKMRNACLVAKYLNAVKVTKQIAEEKDLLKDQILLACKEDKVKSINNSVDEIYIVETNPKIVEVEKASKKLPYEEFIKIAKITIKDAQRVFSQNQMDEITTEGAIKVSLKSRKVV